MLFLEVSLSYQSRRSFSESANLLSGDERDSKESRYAPRQIYYHNHKFITQTVPVQYVIRKEVATYVCNVVCMDIHL